MFRSPMLATLILLATLFTCAVYASPEPGQQAVNLNTASVELLASLDGIGESKAEAIIAYRDSHGPFQDTAELVNVRGIGERTVEKNADRLTVE